VLVFLCDCGWSVQGSEARRRSFARRIGAHVVLSHGATAEGRDAASRYVLGLIAADAQGRR